MIKYISLFLFLISFQSVAQNTSDSSVSKIVLSGVYSGRNIYVQNPFADVANNIYCTDSVFVNGMKCITELNHVSDLNQFAYEINLNSIVKILGTEVTVVIYHKKTCRPKALVSMAFPQARSKVEFTSFQIDTTGHIHITTRNTPTENRPPFQFEQLRVNEWRVIMVIPQKWKLENTYDTIVSLTPGLNTFRLSEMGYGKFGKVITVESGIPDITCTLDSAMNCITCSDTTYYEIQTSSKIKLGSVYTKKIDISDLTNGSYILFYENQQLMFDIKRPKKKNK